MPAPRHRGSSESFQPGPGLDEFGGRGEARRRGRARGLPHFARTGHDSPRVHPVLGYVKLPRDGGGPDGFESCDDVTERQVGRRFPAFECPRPRLEPAGPSLIAERAGARCSQRTSPGANPATPVQSTACQRRPRSRGKGSGARSGLTDDHGERTSAKDAAARRQAQKPPKMGIEKAAGLLRRPFLKWWTLPGSNW